MNLRPHTIFIVWSILGVAISLPSTLQANEPFIQVERIENCLRHSNDKYQCIGSAAGACSDLPTGGSIKGMRTCVNLERAYWLSHAERTMTDLLKRAVDLNEETSSAHKPKKLETGLIEMQQGWINFRDALCGLYDHGQEGNLLRVDSCLMQNDAEQALYLFSISEDYLLR